MAGGGGRPLRQPGRSVLPPPRPPAGPQRAGDCHQRRAVLAFLAVPARAGQALPSPARLRGPPGPPGTSPRAHGLMKEARFPPSLASLRVTPRRCCLLPPLPPRFTLIAVPPALGLSVMVGLVSAMPLGWRVPPASPVTLRVPSVPWMVFHAPAPGWGCWAALCRFYTDLSAF